MNDISYTLKIGLLYVFLTSLLVGVGYVLGGVRMVPLFLGMGLLMNGISYWFSDKIALSMARARLLEEKERPELYSDLRELSSKMNLPVPKLYISDEMQPNAFATGRDYHNAVVCVTKGLLTTLSREEVKGVLAHELAHIKNRDVLLVTIAAVIAGTITALAQFGSAFAFRSGDNDRGGGSIILLILSPIIALMIQLAISRAREFSADDGSAEATGDPRYLAQALTKIHHQAERIPMQTNPALSSLYIDNPFPGGGLTELFSTHPNFEKRVNRLLSKIGHSEMI